jgi:hypothetical protein
VNVKWPYKKESLWIICLQNYFHSPLSSYLDFHNSCNLHFTNQSPSESFRLIFFTATNMYCQLVVSFWPIYAGFMPDLG